MKAVKGPKKAKGLIDDIRNKFEKIKRSGQTTVDKAVSTIVNLPEQVKSEVQDKLDPIFQKAEDIKKTAVAVVSGPTELSKSVRDILKKHGGKTIVSASIVRTPVSSVVKEALNVVSLGEFKRKLKQQPYDDIFHLFMLMTLSDGTTVSLEKNSIITMRVNPSRKGESREASPPEGLTLDSLMENTKRKMGAKFIPYSAKSANCQNFILNVLRANKMATPELETFVKQDTDALFEGDEGFLRKFSNTITDIGAKIATVQEGGAIKKANAWIEHCKAEAARRGISYREAMRSAETKETYKK
jgi:hypothetical protein